MYVFVKRRNFDEQYSFAITVVMKTAKTKELALQIVYVVDVLHYKKQPLYCTVTRFQFELLWRFNRNRNIQCVFKLTPSLVYCT